MPTSIIATSKSVFAAGACAGQARVSDLEAAVVTMGYYSMEWLYTSLYGLFKARFVSGEGPWNGWERVRRGQARPKAARIGSVGKDAVYATAAFFDVDAWN